MVGVSVIRFLFLMVSGSSYSNSRYSDNSLYSSNSGYGRKSSGYGGVIFNVLN